MTDWYPTIKTIKGKPYLYRQRTWREGGRVRSQSQYVGPIDVSGRPASEAEDSTTTRRRRRSRVNAGAMLVFGVEDEYGRRVESLWNRYINKEQKPAAKPEAEEKGKPAGAGQGEKSSFSVLGNGESDEPTATGSQSSSDPLVN